jgi:tetratricopeptide (TPR) repeat protein
MLARRLLPALLLLAGCAAQPPSPPTAAAPRARNPDAEQEELIRDAYLAIKAGMPEQAIDRALDPIIATFERRWGNGPRRAYSARTPIETIHYLTDAAARHEDAIVIGPVWAEAFKLKAYALYDLGRLDEARATLDKALALSPENATFLEELGAQYESVKNWPEAMRAFEKAEAAAKTFSPPALRDIELARAWRGEAFVDAETGKLDDAERLYLRCLELDKNDSRAAAELDYVRRKRAENAKK